MAMRQLFIIFTLYLSPLLIYGQIIHDCDVEPEFFGSLLELSSTNQDPGEISLQPYLYGGYIYGSYNNDWSFSSSPQYGILNPQVVGYIGLNKYVEIDFTLQSQTVFLNNRAETHLSDFTAGFGFQFLWENKQTATPNIRLVILETFPTGKFENLGPDFGGYNATGYGAFSTFFGLVANKTFYNNPCHPFNLSANIAYFYTCDTKVHGINSYGGGSGTKGKVSPGDAVYLLLSYESFINHLLTFTLDFQYIHTFKTNFDGVLGVDIDGVSFEISQNSSDLFTLTPAIEFTFNDYLSCYIGAYLTLFGRNTAATAQGAFSLIYSF